MLVSNWAQNYWAVSTVAKKSLYDYKNVFGRVVEPFIGSKDLDEVSLMDIQILVGSNLHKSNKCQMSSSLQFPSRSKSGVIRH